MPRTKGSRGKKVIEREARERLFNENVARLSALEAAAKAGGVDAVVAAAMPVKKLAKDVLEELVTLYMGMAALYQVWPTAAGKNPHEDEGRFRYYSERAAVVARDVAVYQTPRLSAVAIGASVVNEVRVVGGMPDDYTAQSGGIEIAPGTIITADPVDDGDGGAKPSIAAA